MAKQETQHYNGLQHEEDEALAASISAAVTDGRYFKLQLDTGQVQRSGIQKNRTHLPPPKKKSGQARIFCSFQPGSAPIATGRAFTAGTSWGCPEEGASIWAFGMQDL